MEAPALEHGCWADLWSHQNYHGDRLELRGPSNQRDLASRSRGKDHTWKDAITSLTTGPGTWLYAWIDVDRRSTRLAVGPSTCIRELDGEFKGKIRSIAIADRLPDDWTGATLQPKERRGQVMSDLRRRSANATLKGLAESVVSAIPGVGSVLKTFLDVFWPGGPSKADLVEDGKEWVESLLFDVVAKLENEEYRESLESLYTAIWRLIEERNEDDVASSFKHLRDEVDHLMPKFTSTKHAAENLGYVVTFGTLALGVYRIDWLHGKQSLEATHHNDVTRNIAKLRRAVLDGLAKARAARLAKVESKDSGNRGGASQAVDGYSGWNGPAHGYGDGQSARQTAAANNAAAEAAFFRDSCAAPTFDADFDGYAEVADLWTYFDQPPGFSIKRETRTVRMGMWGQPMPPKSNEVSAAFDVQLADGQRFTEVVLHGNDGCAGIEIYVDGQRKGRWGQTKDADTDVTKVPLGEGQEITGVLGSWSASGLHRVVLRVEPAADGYPYHRGAGIRDGGTGFASNGPDGVFARLTGLFGQVDSADRLRALGCQWTYDRVVPLEIPDPEEDEKAPA